MTPYEQFWWNWSLNVVLAVATLSAVLAALFGDWFRAKLFKPRLAIELLNPAGMPTRVQLTFNGQSQLELARFYHLRVSNPARWPAASQVQVHLTRVEEPGPDGEWQIKWTGEVPLRWSLQAIRPLTAVIGPTMDCDLCSVVKGKWLELHPLMVPNSLADLAKRRDAAVMLITLQARATECDSPLLRLQLSWDGKWEDGEAEMAKHFVIKQIN